MEAFARSREWTIVGDYVDGGESGRDTDRPGYLQMMAESDKWDALLVVKLDRIHRNSLNFAKMFDTLKAAGKDFVSLSENFDTTTAFGRFAMDIIARLAQLESEQIGERTRLGMVQAGKSGRHNGPPPFGYTIHKGVLEPLKRESKTASDIFMMRSQGLSYGRIAERLNEDGIRSKKGSTWKASTVRGIVTNPVYAGFVSCEGRLYPGAHRPIVPLDLWESLNGRMDGRSDA